MRRAAKRSAPGLGEIKRMYVAPARAARGASRGGCSARSRTRRASSGYERVRLDTAAAAGGAGAVRGPRGYAEIPDYNGNPTATLWVEKEL